MVLYVVDGFYVADGLYLVDGPYLVNGFYVSMDGFCLVCRSRGDDGVDLVGTAGDDV